MRKWLEKVKSKQSRLSVLDRYCEFTDKDPEVLIKEHHEDINRPPLKKTKI